MEPVKRGPGRPRKNPLPAVLEESKVPKDVAWEGDKTVTLYALVPCKPSGFRIVETSMALQDVDAFGGRDAGSLLIDRLLSHHTKGVMR